MKRTTRNAAITLAAAATLTACTTTHTNDSTTVRAVTPAETGYVDHVLVSLPTDHFNAFNKFAAENLQGAWFQRDGYKCFIVCSTIHPYIEIWNAGRVEMPWHLGSQVAFSTPDIDQGLDLARRYYGKPPADWTQAGAPGLITLGHGDMSHPLGGTFFVSYGPDFQPAGSPTSPLATLDELVTILPPEHMTETDAYRAFGFEELASPDGVTFRDNRNTHVRFIERPFFEIQMAGHAQLRFTLNEPVAEPREVQISDDGIMKALYEGNTVTIILTADTSDDVDSVDEMDPEGS